MFVRFDQRARRASLCAALLGAGLSIAAPASAQDASAQATEKAVDNLLQGLVDQRVLTVKKAQALANKFHADLAQGAKAQAQQAQTAQAAAPTEVPPGTVRVPYVPQTVKDQIRDQVKDEVIAQAKRENWAQPDAVPGWVKHVKLFGDVRFRDEGQYFDKNNATDFVNVQAINAGSGYNTGPNNSFYPPILNTTKDLNIFRLRARLGVQADIDDDWSATIMLATGSDDSPVSNQTLGSDFDKKPIWLDLANIKYEPFDGDRIVAGRMENPFDQTELMWHNTVMLDGISASFTTPRAYHGFSLSAVGGAFPLDYNAGTFPSTATSNQKVGMSADEWLYAGGITGKWESTFAKFSLSGTYYDFNNIQGQLSPACSNEEDFCYTDQTRPVFMQQGNTLFALRNTTYPDPTNLTDVQYYGLASKFQIVDVVGRADVPLTNSVHLMLTGDYARNLAFSSKDIAALPIVNNNEACSVVIPPNSGETCQQAGGKNLFHSGNQAWSVELGLGRPEINERWDWNVSFDYKYLEPDAVVDAFTDPDFHLGGTNAKGFILGANLGLAHNTWLNVRWLSADQVTGPQYGVDVLQIDLNTKF